ncbi:MULTISPECIES: helix-turn-helix domain-containing protein [Pseudomonas]|jgi:ribosome-binding protein aMBF1 (putative translation factor)|uniref:Transcriptional regulator n=1 Tax=Pseudomonas soli TaxID=1306993 RepID=A0A2V4IVL0_9PSED|nr:MULTISPECIES: helix-turn-helix transcriptional regulator [Pseudomonas]MBI6953188.1 helix-turn-helix transcriptional regulator [Pseudomonas sp. CCOS 191]PYB85167.1 transcriptional regulator [Pseudomonas soli]PZW86702.1 helix-turn-helix protein [Pseudomonas sp. 2848]UVM15647.1 helix-turn-helix transcriptional regulator [Pseudomonas sp. B21-023]
MGIQVISRDGQPEYAVVPWEQYQALLAAAGQAPASAPVTESNVASTQPSASLSSLAELASLRQAKGLAPEQLARSVGISPAYLAMIESGERRPDAAILRSLAWHLGVAGWSEPS